MKKLFPALLLACALVVPAALTAATFEGKVTMQMSSGQKAGAQDMTYSIKDDLVRIDMQIKDKSGKSAGGMGGMIMDAKKQEMIMLMPQQQMYMVHSLAAPTGQPGAAHEGADKVPEYSLDKTGETETILGYKCEKFVMKTDKSSTAMWLTSELGGFMGSGSGGMGGFGGRRGSGSQQAQAWEKALAGKNMFPMRVVGSSPDGKESFRMEVTAVEKQSLPASDFQVPAGWRKFEMPNMEEMMKSMGGGR